MPVLRVKHARGVARVKTAPFDEVTLNGLKPLIATTLKLPAGGDFSRLLACSHSALHEKPFDSIDPSVDVKDDGDATLKDLGLRNGSFVYVAVPDDLWPDAPTRALGAAPAGPPPRPTGAVTPQQLQEWRVQTAEYHKHIELSVEYVQRREAVTVPEECTVGELKAAVRAKFRLPATAALVLWKSDDGQTATARGRFENDALKVMGEQAGPLLERIGSRLQLEVQEGEEEEEEGEAGAGGAATGAAADGGAGRATSAGAGDAGASATAGDDSAAAAGGASSRTRAPVSAPTDVHALAEWRRRNVPVMMPQPASQRFVDHIEIDVNPFIDLRPEERRVAWLFGAVRPNAADGSRRDVVVQYIYEPPQMGFRERFLLLEDQHRDDVDMIAQNLGLELVGWIFSCPFRGSVHNVMSASEVAVAASLQAEHPHFVTLVFGFEQEQVLGTRGRDNVRNAAGPRMRTWRSTTAYQVSKQGVDMFRQGLLMAHPPEDPFVLRSSKPVVAEDPDSMDPVQHETQRFHTAYVVTAVGIMQLADKDRLFPVRPRVPAASRRDKLSGDVYPLPTPKRLGTTLFRIGGGSLEEARTIGSTMLERITDFSLLLYIATRPDSQWCNGVTFKKSEIRELCRAVRGRDAELAASFRFKLMAAFDAGWLNPYTEHDDVRPTLQQLYRVVKQAFKDDPRAVINPLNSARSHTRVGREKVAANLWEELERSGRVTII